MTRLLIIKAGKHYFKFSGESAAACTFNKASVYPIEEIEEVKIKQRQLRESGFRDAEIRLLTITEEKYKEVY